MGVLFQEWKAPVSVKNAGFVTNSSLELQTPRGDVSPGD